MALEDAVALARCLAAHNDLHKAFAAYDSLRREPTRAAAEPSVIRNLPVPIEPSHEPGHRISAARLID